MSTELSITSLADTVRDRVRKVVMDSLPDEQLDALFKKEFEDYFEPQPPPQYVNGYPNHDKIMRPSQFSILIKKYVEEYLNEKITTSIREKLEEMELWNAEKSNELLRATVAELAPIVLQNLGSQLVRQTLQSVQQSGTY